METLAETPAVMALPLQLPKDKSRRWAKSSNASYCGMDKKAKTVRHAMKNMERNRCTKSKLIRWGAAAFGDPVGGLILTAICVCVCVRRQPEEIQVDYNDTRTLSRDYPWYGW